MLFLNLLFVFNNNKVVATDVLSGGKFYVQKSSDGEVASIQQKLASLSIKDAPVIGSFNPAKGSIVLAQFSLDNSWNRAMVSTLYVDPLLPNNTHLHFPFSLLQIAKYHWFQH
jgi:Tudor domain